MDTNTADYFTGSCGHIHSTYAKAVMCVRIERPTDRKVARVLDGETNPDLTWNVCDDRLCDDLDCEGCF